MIKVLTTMEIAQHFHGDPQASWTEDAAYALASALNEAMPEDALIPDCAMIRGMFQHWEFLWEAVRADHISDEKAAEAVGLTLAEWSEVVTAEEGTEEVIKASVKLTQACYDNLVASERTVIPTGSGFVIQRSREDKEPEIELGQPENL